MKLTEFDSQLLTWLEIEIERVRGEVAKLYREEGNWPPQSTPEARAYWTGVGRVEALLDVRETLRSGRNVITG